jgi:hypothetical protein
LSFDNVFLNKKILSLGHFSFEKINYFEIDSERIHKLFESFERKKKVFFDRKQKIKIFFDRIFF